MQKSFRETASFIIQVLISATLLFICLAIVFNIPHSKVATAILTVIIGVIFLLSYGKELHLIHYIVGGYIVILDLWAYRNLDNMFSLSRSLFWVFLALAIGYLVKRKKISYLTMLIPFLAISALFTILMIFQIEQVDDGRLYYMNRNSIPVFSLSYGALMNVIWSRQHNSKPQIWPSILILFLSFLSKSRIGLFASILYLILNMMPYIIPVARKFRKEWKLSKRKVIALIFLIIASAVIILLLIKYSRFNTVGVSSNGRVKIIESYFSELTLRNFITGFNHTEIDKLLSKNLHNSFINLLMSTGLLSAPVFVIYGIAGLKLFKKSYYLFGLFIILGIYSLVEKFIFFGIGDFILIPIIYLSFEASEQVTILNHTDKEYNS